MPTESVPFVPAGQAAERAVIGIAVATGLDRATAVLAQARGRSLASHVQVVRAATRDLPHDVYVQYQEILGGDAFRPGAAARLAGQLAELEATLVRELAPAAPSPDVIAVGVHEPGLWHLSDDIPQARIALCDAARLAEATGLTVIDDFPARDLAAGGRGGPIDATAQWVLLRDASQCRLLVDLGRTTRLVFLPPTGGSTLGAERVMALDVGPGMALLDRLTSQFTDGKHGFDPGGRLAVQGRHMPDLLEHLLAAPYFEKPLPRWHPFGVAPEWFLNESIRAAVASGWSVRDLLCTATHLIAESLVRAIADHVPKSPPVAQLVLTGGGLRNGFMIREIHRRLPDLPCVQIDQLGIQPQHLDAASVAILSLLHLDQVPQTHTLITGAATPRVLGRLTPGAPRPWQQLLAQLNENRPETMSLRSAI
jgi:anhydro-N-acetylmuramic acid kinase